MTETEDEDEVGSRLGRAKCVPAIGVRETEEVVDSPCFYGEHPALSPNDSALEKHARS